MHDRLELLIQRMREKGFLTDQTIENAIRTTPRHLFVPQQHVEEAYEDRPLETKNFQTITQPSVVARMTEWLELESGLKVLEIGTGSGWQSAIIEKIVFPAKVFSVERVLELVKFAKDNHKRANVKNVKVLHYDGTNGLGEKAPFDRIIITAACEKIPQSLIKQLANGGLLIAPIGRDIQEMTVFKKIKDRFFEIRKENGYVFVPLVEKTVA